MRGSEPDNKTPPEEWMRRYYRLAQHVAHWSKDPSTKVGAVLVGINRTEICLGYNGFPPGLDDDPGKLLDKHYKYARTQHAERNAIDNARFDVRFGILAVTMFPCSECTKSLISRGIRHIISPPPIDRDPWAIDALVTKSMLKEVEIIKWTNAEEL